MRRLCLPLSSNVRFTTQPLTKLKEEKNMNFDQLDLEPIKFKLMNKKSGLGWSLEFCDEVEQQYKKWMMLVAQYPDIHLVPSHFVDIFWHYHILDTQKYAADCLHSFGYFVHHYPYFGMQDEEDKNKASKAWEKTKEIFKNEFNIELDYIEKSYVLNNTSASCDTQPNCNDNPDCTPGACYGQECNPQGECEKQINKIEVNLNAINKIRPRP
jgi:hypothetical protein